MNNLSQHCRGLQSLSLYSIYCGTYCNWLLLARRILSHAGVTGVTDQQLIALTAPCNGSARDITDAIISVALKARLANQLAVNTHP